MPLDDNIFVGLFATLGPILEFQPSWKDNLNILKVEYHWYNCPQILNWSLGDQTSLNQYDIGRRGCTLMSSLSKANWDRQAGGRAQVSIGMHAHPKMSNIKFDKCTWIHVAALTYFQCRGCVHLAAFTMLHSLGCIHQVAFTWLHLSSLDCIS